MTAASAEPRPRSRMRIAGLVAAAILLTGLFMVLRFPYDRLADLLVRRVEQSSSARIRLGHVSPSWVRWGPGFQAVDVVVEQSNGSRAELARVAARPALSLSWLSGAPAVATEIEAPVGRLSGVVTLGEQQGFVGELSDVDLAQLPLNLGPRASLAGTADAEIDLTLAPDGPEGSVRFAAREGSLAHPAFPLAIPFEKLTGDLRLGGEQWAQIRDVELDSPLASGHAKGTVGRGQSLASAPLRIEIELEVAAAIRGSLNAQGVTVGRDGKVSVLVMGTLVQPLLR